MALDESVPELDLKHDGSQLQSSKLSLALPFKGSRHARYLFNDDDYCSTICTTSTLLYVCKEKSGLSFIPF